MGWAVAKEPGERTGQRGAPNPDPYRAALGSADRASQPDAGSFSVYSGQGGASLSPEE